VRLLHLLLISPRLISIHHQHCRKCGGIFCADCSPHSIPLLDTSNLNFIHPPRGAPIIAFESPCSPIARSRVCVECYDQINGLPVLSRTPDLSFSSPLTCDTKLPYSSNSSVISTPSDSVSHLPRPAVRRIHNLPDFPQIPPPPPAHGLGSDDDLGELAAYPLRYSSAICKKTGGGRWYPKKTNTIEGYRIPGCKAQYEIDMEREEEELRRFRLNPVFKDGGLCLQPCFRSFPLCSQQLSQISSIVRPVRWNHNPSEVLVLSCFPLSDCYLAIDVTRFLTLFLWVTWSHCAYTVLMCFAPLPFLSILIDVLF